jgi:hypothetical protein
MFTSFTIFGHPLDLQLSLAFIYLPRVEWNIPHVVGRFLIKIINIFLLFLYIIFQQNLDNIFTKQGPLNTDFASTNFLFRSNLYLLCRVRMCVPTSFLQRDIADYPWKNLILDQYLRVIIRRLNIYFKYVLTGHVFYHIVSGSWVPSWWRYILPPTLCSNQE